MCVCVCVCVCVSLYVVCVCVCVRAFALSPSSLLHGENPRHMNEGAVKSTFKSLGISDTFFIFMCFRRSWFVTPVLILKTSSEPLSYEGKGACGCVMQIRGACHAN